MSHPVRGRRTRGRISAGLWIMRVVFWPMADLLFTREVHGADRVPATGPALLAANHVSITDPVHFARFVWDAGRVPRFLAKSSLYRWPAGLILRSAGQIPVYRATPQAPDSLRAAVSALDADAVVCIYPEGSVTRDPQWWPMAAKNGVARLALETGAPVIPVAQWGPQATHDYHTKTWSVFPRKHGIIRVGEQVDLSRYLGRPSTAALLREVTEVIMDRIRAELSIVRAEPAPTVIHPNPATGSPSDGADRADE